MHVCFEGIVLPSLSLGTSFGMSMNQSHGIRRLSVACHDVSCGEERGLLENRCDVYAESRLS